MKTRMISVRCPPRLASHLDELCQVSLRKRSEVIRLLIARARLDDLPQAWGQLSQAERELLTERQ
jgi:metal-responsive CopG/Arc/MetJ family transcriptional regulator